jgi:CelD/BcsL family acetyltransferase involved in cellulose biosynthesis
MTPEPLTVSPVSRGEMRTPAATRAEHAIGRITWHFERSADAAVARGGVRQLWAADPMASPFASEAFLQVCAERAAAAGATPLFVRGSSAGRTVAIWPLVISSNGGVGFLQTPHADHSTCLAAPGVDAAAVGEGLALALRFVRPRDLLLERVPPWGLTLDAIRSGLTQSAWPSCQFPVLMNPVVGAPPGPRATDALYAQFHRHSRLRTKENKVKRLPGYAFEVLEQDDDLESWASDFCAVHEWRWNPTDTPSELRRAEAREAFLENLYAWSRDRLLRRFAIRIDHQRHAFAACLVGGDRLLYHLLATRPGNGALSLGKVLLRMVGVWASQNGLSTLDLGMGGEGYKFEFATHTDMLWKVYAAPKASVRVSAGRIEQRIRQTPAAFNVWKTVIHDFVRGRVMTTARRSQRAVHTLRTARSSTWGALVPLGGIRRRNPDLATYRAAGRAAVPSPQVVRFSTAEVLNLLDQPPSRPPAARANAIERSYAGATAVALLRNGQPIMSVWLMPPDAQKADAAWRIEPFLLFRGARARGALTQLLSSCLAMVPEGAPVRVQVPRAARIEQELQSAGFQRETSPAADQTGTLAAGADHEAGTAVTKS